MFKYFNWVFPALTLLGITLLGCRMGCAEEPVLHIYSWVDYVPQELIKKFERETGIKIVYDVYDSNDVLEAKLLTGSSRYDIVCPSAWPYVGPQIIAGAYIPLDMSKLPNKKYLDPFLMAKLQEPDPQNLYLIPYTWGVTGIGLNKKKVLEIFPKAKLDSLALIFDIETVKKFKKCGVSLLDEEVDVFPMALLYLGLDPNSQKKEDIDQAADLLMKIRPYISRFGGFQSAMDLGMGELCVVQGWSTEVLKAHKATEESKNGVEVYFSIPQEGAAMWMDVHAIPKGAPHPENAHKFINFLMDPQNAAIAGNYLTIAIPIPEALPLIRKELRSNPAIFPPEAMRKKLFVDKTPSQDVKRYRSRLWFDIRAGRFSRQRSTMHH